MVNVSKTSVCGSTVEARSLTCASILPVEIGDHLIDRFDRVLCAADVLAFFHRAAGPANGRGRLADVAAAVDLASAQRAQQRRAKRDGRLHLLLIGLRLLAIHRLLRLAFAFLQRRQPWARTSVAVAPPAYRAVRACPASSGCGNRARLRRVWTRSWCWGCKTDSTCCVPYNHVTKSFCHAA